MENYLTSSMGHHLRRRNVATSVVGLKKKQKKKTAPHAKISPKMANPGYIAGNAEEEEKEEEEEEEEEGGGGGGGGEEEEEEEEEEE